MVTEHERLLATMQRQPERHKWMPRLTDRAYRHGLRPVWERRLMSLESYWQFRQGDRLDQMS